MIALCMLQSAFALQQIALPHLWYNDKGKIEIFELAGEKYVRN